MKSMVVAIPTPDELYETLLQQHQRARKKLHFFQHEDCVRFGEFLALILDRTPVARRGQIRVKRCAATVPSVRGDFLRLHYGTIEAKRDTSVGDYGPWVRVWRERSDDLVAFGWQLLQEPHPDAKCATFVLPPDVMSFWPERRDK
jgi:hypothetical protein